jgi:hypothetical protein
VSYGFSGDPFGAFTAGLGGTKWERPGAAAEEALCKRMCEAMKQQGIKLRWEQVGEYGHRLVARESNGTMRRGPLGISKRAAMVGLARQVMR